jgi:hypothetical protein
MAFSGMLRRVAIVRTDVSKEVVHNSPILITLMKEALCRRNPEANKKKGVFWDITPCDCCKNRLTFHNRHFDQEVTENSYFMEIALFNFCSSNSSSCGPVYVLVYKTVKSHSSYCVTSA